MDAKIRKKNNIERLLQGFDGTGTGAVVAEDALGGVFPLTGVVVHLDIHRTHLQTFAAVYTFLLIAMDAQQGIAARGF